MTFEESSSVTAHEISNKIRELERQNVELQAMIDNYHDTDNDIHELRKAVAFKE